jgi:hypothetical protein
MKLRPVFAIVLALAGSQAFACYTVYGNDNRVLYQGTAAPVDMSLPLHQTVPAAFPGGHLVFSAGETCPVEQVTARRAVAPPSAGGSPLLTDRATATAMGVPHTVLASGIAVVRQRPDDMRPGVVVAESGLPPAAPNTAMMGAGPARPARGNTVITEMHNPPMTAVQPAPSGRR